MSKRPRICILLDLAGAYGRGLLRGVAAYAARHTRWEFFVDTWYETGRRDGLDFLKSDGILCGLSSTHFAKAIRKSGVPAVNLSNSFDDSDPDVLLPSVLSDDVAVGRLAAEHFLNAGFRHFGFYHVKRRPFSEQRLAGFCKRLREAGRDCSVHDADPNYNYLHVRAIEKDLIDWIRSQPKPIAVAACNDHRCRHLARACLQAGIRVPGEVALLGVDNDDLLCQLSIPPLSSIQLDAHTIGSEAAALLARLMEGKRPPASPLRVPPLAVIRRQSTDILTVPDPDIADAIRFIRDRAHTGIRVSDVLAAVPLGRRTLEQRFVAALGHPPAVEIRRARLARACELLRDSTLSIAQIADSCGYTSPKEFSVAFHREQSQTPSAYRRAHSRTRA